MSKRDFEHLKTEFVSLASHQMRTPLSAAKWHLEALLENKHGLPMNEWQKEKLQQAYDSNERMINLINDLLNTARLESGRLKLNLEKTSINEILCSVAAEMSFFARANNAEVKCEVDPQLPAVAADQERIRQVAENLVNNAIRYCKRKQTIKIKAKKRKREIVFSIADQGIGIPPKDKEKIFGKFIRASNGEKINTEGSGLGLYIAKQIIQLHGGKIWCQSRLNKGSTFYFTLPIWQKRKKF